ncbi:MAG: sulfatase activating formylglycine-generating enzyme [Myxococcota bacterium]|jgi:formylglycine-generating enzyme required for sulfatase activity
MRFAALFSLLSLACGLAGCAKGRTPPELTQMVTIQGDGGAPITYTWGSELDCRDGDEDSDQFCEQSPPDATYPVMTVTVPAFTIDAHEVTNLQFQHCVAKGVCSKPNAVNALADGNAFQKYYDADSAVFAEHPVINVTWLQAFEYCGSVGKRLPTEFEWEAAARTSSGGTAERFPWGEDLADCENSSVVSRTCNAGLDTPQAVRNSSSDDLILHGGKELFGMAGNVSEWVSTPFVEDVSCSPAPQVFACQIAHDDCKDEAAADYDLCVQQRSKCDSCQADEGGAAPECYGMCLSTSNRRFWICERRSQTFEPAPESGSGSAVRAFRGGHYAEESLCSMRPWARSGKSLTGGKSSPTLGFRCAKNIE